MVTKDFYFPMVLIKVPTAPSDCFYIPRVSSVVMILVSQYPIFHAVALILTTLLFPCHTCSCLTGQEGGQVIADLEHWMLTATLAHHRSKIRTELKLFFFFFFLTMNIHDIFRTYHFRSFHLRWIWLKFRIYCDIAEPDGQYISNT